MPPFRVWAPRARRVEVVVEGARRDMAGGERGWWEAEGAEPGARYGFSIDGGEVRPDPRSASQPDGVLGLSEVVDHRAFEWNDAAWRGTPLAGTVMYELHAGTFAGEGTFGSAAAKLGHLVELGVTAVELMPVAEFGGNRGWGYDGAALYAPHHAYGGPAGLKHFVDACHAAGLAAVLDVVYNHLGPVGNFLGEFGPYFTDRHRTDWGAALNYDGRGSDEVRRFIVDNALMWIRDYHFDGLRLDAVNVIVDQSPVHILEQLAVEVAALGEELHRTVFLVAESDANDPRLVRSREAGGYGLDAVWSDDWHHSLHTALTGERTGYYRDYGSLEQLGKALKHAWVYDGAWSEYRQRTRGRRATEVPSHRFVIAAQNHDQVGNRATGDRLGARLSEGELKAAAALLLTAPFTPLLFQGEEWAADSPFLFFTDFSDPELGRAVREGRRREFEAFGWNPDEVPDPQDLATFETSKLSWSELDEPFHRSMVAWHRDLIALRRRLPAPRDPAGEGVSVEIDDALGRIMFEREGVRVLVNLGEAGWEAALPAGLVPLMTSDPPVDRDAGRVVVPPRGVVVLEARPSD
jgi:maltooligosyltrehalose trehalohydrolase